MIESKIELKVTFIAFHGLLPTLFQSVMHLISTATLFLWLRFAGFLVQLLILAWWILRLSGLIG